ncbi:dihydroxyacetone kinase subunit DhaL [Aureimonas leprariae]|uniref:Dihydroxyacetone kinase subunit DhaK n=1 Tax=Plantimonas leprariae TaxID=2615207 RepID=A0A7V7TVN7_9HYPH|nr:dihydroxyacetone kinase subunit DhaL [Aureimonas leprariae]KAB0678837.1 dihydroxyacetone kinase subunit DhaK [Aureimonas leprariae]
MKKLINDPAAVVDDMLRGLTLAHDGLTRLDGEQVIVRADIDTFRASGQVALISGGGSGHEPAHAGYVGSGMLSAAVCGEVFTSPSTDAVLAAIRAVASPAGVLLIVKNYTGDRLNFGLAAEIARTEGTPVEMLIVDDDAALAGEDETAGRRGIAGTVFVHKIAGAAAAEGRPLAEVHAAAAGAVARLATMGVALTPCTVPAAGVPSFALGESEVELGLGIHGESGVRRAPLQPAAELVATLMDTILADRASGAEPVALLVNGLGATPPMELAIVAEAAVRAAEAKGRKVERLFVGTFLSALDMAGASVSALALGPEMLARLDAPTDAPAWPGRGSEPSSGRRRTVAGTAAPRSIDADDDTGDAEAARRTIDAILAALAAVEAAEPALTANDREVGDGDLGINLARGAAAIRAEIEGYRTLSPAAILARMSATLRRVVGGTSGALYAVMLLRAGAALDGIAAPAKADWAHAARAGVDAVAALGDAKLGDRTMLDALLPAVERLEAGGSDALARGARAAREGAEATAGLRPRRGRSSYLGDRAVGRPDPGAEAVAVWLGAVADTLAKR